MGCFLEGTFVVLGAATVDEEAGWLLFPLAAGGAAGCLGLTGDGKSFITFVGTGVVEARDPGLR